MKFADLKDTYYSNNLVRFLILFYWSIYWLFNSIDKFIGGSQFLWVGKDRFAQFQRYFDSAGWGKPIVSDIALIIVGSLEIFAFLFFIGAFIQLVKKNETTSKSWFIVGISLTLSIFTIFSIGDHVFGDRFELLEHTLFWTLTLFTWVIYIHSEKLISIQKKVLNKKQIILASVVFLFIVLITNISIFNHKDEAYHERRDSVIATVEGANLFKCTFPFLAGSTSFERTLERFKKEYPNKQIKQIYTVPDKLRKQKADALIVYITTGDKNQ